MIEILGCTNDSDLMFTSVHLLLNFDKFCCQCLLFVNTVPLHFQCRSGNREVKELNEKKIQVIPKGSECRKVFFLLTCLSAKATAKQYACLGIKCPLVCTSSIRDEQIL